MNKICVLGSMNMDLVLKVKDMPKVGETILSKSFQKIAGGKGANQAVAAKRSGAEVFMISKIGKDENGRELRDKLVEDNIDVKYVFEDRIEPTGMALIMVNDNGNNSIIVNAGSNMTLTKEEIDYLINQLTQNSRKTTQIILRIKPDRIHTLIPGLIILKELIQNLSIQDLTIAYTGLREGYFIKKTE